MASVESDRQRVLSSLGVSRETERRLDIFVATLLRWQRVQNLIASSTIPDIWTRHIEDSAQLLRLIDQPRRLVDLGSGAGFPGLVLAILTHEAPFPVHLVESNSGKAAFLREAARVTGTAVEIHPQRVGNVVENLDGHGCVVTARALAPLIGLLDMTEPLLKTGAFALFLKGREARQELTDADKSWRLDAELVPSITDPRAHIVRVRSAVRRTSDA